jgi:hypothetical protein
MTMKSLGVLIAGLALAMTAPPPPDASIALLSKVILDVTRKQEGKDWQKAKQGDILVSGERIKTGIKSIAIIKFKDNSLIRVRERSELIVNGTTTKNALTKTVEVDNGVIGFNIKKQQTGEEFRFASPTSVASIRGTGGLFTSRASNDTLTVTEGLVTFTNRKTSQSVAVQEGFTGISLSNGTIIARPSTREERQAADDANHVGDQLKKIEFELRDNQGKPKQLRIEFKE